MSEQAAVAPRLRLAVLARCFWRSLFLQAAWNRRGMQNLGFAYAIDPALRALYPDPARRREALGRHLGFFNCHPYAAAAILGGAIHHEQKVAAGLEYASAPGAYKATLQGPLAAIGDGFFWTALRPFFGALAALGALLFGWPAVVLALTTYNAIHLALRMGLFRAGYRQGDAIVGAIARLSLPAAADRLRLGAAALCGLSVVVMAARVEFLGRVAAVPVAILAAAIGYLALARGVRLLVATYAAILAGVGAAFAAGRFRGGL
jgi:PTS system mannose-specific IID component